jgi:hypothetical protein
MPKIKDLGVKVIPETMRPPEIGGGGCSDCTVQQFSICGTTPGMGGGGCSDCTYQPYSICGGTPQVGAARAAACAFTGCDCSFFTCGFVSCRVFTCGFHSCGFSCRFFSDPCRFSQIVAQQTALRPEDIAALKDQLQKQIDALDEAAKAAGPKTAEEIDAREKQLNDELAQLKARRKDLGK